MMLGVACDPAGGGKRSTGHGSNILFELFSKFGDDNSVIFEFYSSTDDLIFWRRYTVDTEAK
jgi:hypothetical protein